MKYVWLYDLYNIGLEGFILIYVLFGMFFEGEMGGGRGWINLGIMFRFLLIINIVLVFLNFFVYYNIKIYIFYYNIKIYIYIFLFFLF